MEVVVVAMATRSAFGIGSLSLLHFVLFIVQKGQRSSTTTAISDATLGATKNCWVNHLSGRSIWKRLSTPSII